MAPVPVVAGESAEPKPKASLGGRIWKKFGFGAAAVAPKKAKMEEPKEPETIEEVIEEEEEEEGEGEGDDVAIQMEVVTNNAPEGEMDVATEETDLGDEQQPRRSLGMIREEQETIRDAVKVQ